MATLIAHAQFIDSATTLGKDGLTVTVDCERITRANGTRAALLTGEAATPVTRNGLYYYVLTGADLTTYDYVFGFTTTDTDVVQRDIAALWTLYSISWHDIATSIMTIVGSIGKLLVDNINATISSRSTVTTAQINAEVDTALSDYDPPTKAEMDAALAALNNLSSAQVWSYATRTLTQPAAQATAAATGETLTLTSHSTWTINLTGMSDISDRSNLVFTVKAKPDDDADTAAIVQVDEDNGLLYIGGAAASDKTKASLTVTDQVAGNATISVHASVTGFQAQSKLSYDVKKITAAGVAIPVAEGRQKFHIQAAVTRAVS